MIVFVDISMVILGVLIIYPIIPLIRNYIWLKSMDYLYFAGIFLFLALNIALEGIDFGTPILNQINHIFFLPTFFISSYTCMLIISSSTISEDQNLPLGKYFWRIFTVFTLAQLFIVRSLEQVLTIEITLLMAIVFELYRLYVGYCIYHVFNNVNHAYKTKRTEKISYLWSINGIIIIIFGIQRIVFMFILFLMESTQLFDQLVLVSRILFIVIVAIGGIISVIIAIKYPESMLISKVQLLKARKLYQIVDAQEKVRKTWSTQVILDYLNSIPEEIWEISRDSGTS